MHVFEHLELDAELNAEVKAEEAGRDGAARSCSLRKDGVCVALDPAGGGGGVEAPKRRHSAYMATGLPACLTARAITAVHIVQLVASPCALTTGCWTPLVLSECFMARV